MTKQTFTVGQVLTAAQMTSLQQTAMGGGSTTAKTASYVLVAADAGTVVQMNAAGATTITVNTALFAAGDSVQIQNIGAGVCTVTAGTATVSTAGSLALSQYEGGQLYFNTTSAALFFDIVQGAGMTNPMTTTGDIIYSSSGSTPARLGIGTTGQVVTVASGLPSWATPSATAFVGCQLTKSASQSIATGTETLVTFNTEAFDTDGFHTGSDSKITIPTGKSGKYLINIQIMSNSSGYVTQGTLYKNTTVDIGLVYLSAATPVTAPCVLFNNIYSLTAGDTVEVKIYQGAGVNKDVLSNAYQLNSTYFSVTYLGA